MLPPENIYGHTKKLRYLLGRLDALQDRLGRRVRVLDFGCGNGEAVSQYMIRKGFDYTGVDFHRPSLEHAAKRFGKRKAKVRGRFLGHTPNDGPYDALVYSDVLEHLDDPVDVLRGHRPLIADHGWLIGSVPNGYGPFEMEKRIGKYTGLGWALSKVHGGLRRCKHKVSGAPKRDALPYNAECGHVQFYTRAAITRTLARGGFVLDDFRKGCFMGASASAFFLRGQGVMKVNNAVAEVLPSFAVSTWYFTATPGEMPADAAQQVGTR
ncbi:MAG: class I SAM-dependent methyltransferase [Phycisphaerales bacterium JB063]